jgi:hypothetical protein
VIYRREKRAVLTGHVHMLVKPKDQEKLDLSELRPFTPMVPDSIAAKRPAAPPSQESQQQKDLQEELRSSKTLRKYPLHLSADRIEYWYRKGNRHAVITGSPQAMQELPDADHWRRAWAYKALYNGETEKLDLQSAPGKRDARMKNSLGDDLTAKWFQVSTKENDEEYEGDEVYGDVAPTGDEDLDTVKGKKPATPTNKPPANPPRTSPTPAPTPTNQPAKSGGSA